MLEMKFHWGRGFLNIMRERLRSFTAKPFRFLEEVLILRFVNRWEWSQRLSHGIFHFLLLAGKWRPHWPRETQWRLNLLLCRRSPQLCWAVLRMKQDCQLARSR